MTTLTDPRTWTILRHRLVNDVAALPLVWGLFAAGVALVTVGLTVFGPDRLSTSVWEQGSQLVRWYVGAVGVYLTAVYLPLYVAHGCTRRQFAAQLPVFILAFASAAALLMTVGYAVEALAYGVLGWPQVLTSTHLFDSPTQYHLVFTELVLLYSVWTVAGALAGAAFYRRFAVGVAVVPAVLLLLGAIEVAVGAEHIGPTRLIGAVLEGGSAAVATPVTVGSVAVGLALLWVVIRDLPIRGKTS